MSPSKKEKKEKEERKRKIEKENSDAESKRRRHRKSISSKNYLKSMAIQMDEQNKRDIMTANDYKGIIKMIKHYTQMQCYNKSVAIRL